ncbi:CDP-alcohol phosphatidyltransferase family protein [Nonomuraea lactucae]|uniref:CDP-alcohol phosphatidyltransferase family protein n=1 Tax=Nonomuraea lactucae TaxID=2249762 RepID=UPI0023DD36C2|nr:CDP-alcohol phosphatidyltransferase family protein [Nonomuraea lactucae]
MTDSMTRASATTAVVLLATTPACRLTCAGGTLLDRITDQLTLLPVRDVQVVTSGGGAGADLRGVAKIARAATGTLVVLPGDLVAHTEALAQLLEHPARGSAALVSLDAGGGPLCPPVRVEGGRVVAAGSSFHTVPDANATFRGVLQAGEADLASLADVAEELAELADTGRLGAVTAVEAVDLLLVGLVRAGARIRATQLGPLHADRVTGQATADGAIGRLAEVDEEQVRLDAAIKDRDGFFATFCVSSWSRHLVRPAARLKLTPNAVTGISVGLAVLAAIWFSAGNRGAQVAGAVLLYLSFVCDCLDGQLARYTRMFSSFGAWMDGMADRLKEYVVYVGLAIGFAAGMPWSGGGPDGIWHLAVAAMILQVVRHALDFSYGGSRADARRVGELWSKPVRSLLESTDEVSHDAPRRGVLKLSLALEHESVTRWLKRMIVLPIGERMALIAVTAAVFNARVTFMALLGWGGLAVVYQLAGRIARTAR